MLFFPAARCSATLRVTTTCTHQGVARSVRPQMSTLGFCHDWRPPIHREILSRREESKDLSHEPVPFRRVEDELRVRGPLEHDQLLRSWRLVKLIADTGEARDVAGSEIPATDDEELAPFHLLGRRDR